MLSASPLGHRAFTVAAVCGVLASLPLLVPLTMLLAASTKRDDIVFLVACLCAGPLALWLTSWRLRTKQSVVPFIVAIVASWPQFLMGMTLAAVGGGEALSLSLLLGAIASMAAIVFVIAGVVKARRAASTPRDG